MNSIWLAAQQWVKSKGGLAHVVAMAYLMGVGAYASVPAFQSLCDHIYGKMPASAHELLLAAVGVLAWYRNTQSRSENGN